MYSDANNNGKFDREIHSELKKEYIYLNFLSKAFNSIRDELTKLSTVLPQAIDWKDTFSVFYNNLIIQYSNGLKDTIKQSIPWNGYVNRGMDILRDDKKWDGFFVNRKRSQPV